MTPPARAVRTSGETLARIHKGLRMVTVPLPHLAGLAGAVRVGIDDRVPTMGVFASGRIVANEVTRPWPTHDGRGLTTDRGARISAADAGSTGGATLLYTSDTIDAGQTFGHVGVHWVAERAVEWAPPLESVEIHSRLLPDLLDNIEAAALAVDDGPRTNPGPWCDRCSYRSICPASQRNRWEPVEYDEDDDE